MKTLAHRTQELALRPQVALHNRIFNSLERLRNREDGGVSIEYVGIVVVVGAIALVLVQAAPGWASSLKGKIDSIIQSITG